MIGVNYCFFCFMGQVKPPCSLSPEETEYLTSRIQNGGTEVVEVL